MASADPFPIHSDRKPLRESPLNFAAFRGDVAKVKERLALGDAVDVRCSDLIDGMASVRTPLACAAERGHARVVPILLEAGADPSAVNSGDGTSILHVAAVNGSVAVVKMLLQAEATIVDWADHKLRTALHAAASSGHAEVVKALIEAQATIDFPTCEGKTALMAAARDGNEECVRLLLQAGADLLKVSAYNHTALHFGVAGGKVAVVRTLLSWGADVNSTGLSEEGGTTPLHLSSESGPVDVMEALLGAGADTERIDQDGRTALHQAAMCGSDHAVKVLIAAGAALDARDRRRTTALYLAAVNGKDDVVKTLMSSGADVDTPDSQGTTALFAARSAGYSTTVKLLLDAGADPQKRDRANTTPLMHAKDLPTVKVLLEAGASVTDVDVDRHTVLHHVGMRGCSGAVICTIYKAGCDPTLLNVSGQTAAESARQKGHNDAAKLLDMLAAKYMQSETGASEANDKPSLAVAPCDGMAGLEAKMSSCVVSSVDDKIDVGSPERSQVKEGRRQHRAQRPCLNCQTLTHRRCARCRTAYICSNQCQVATLAVHRSECLAIYEEKEKAKVEPQVEVGGKKEESD